MDVCWWSERLLKRMNEEDKTKETEWDEEVQDKAEVSEV